MNDRRDEPATKKDLNRVEQKLTDKIDENSYEIDDPSSLFSKSNERMRKLLTKEEFHEGCDKIMRGQEKIIAFLTRMLDQERVATTAWIGRIEGDVEKNKSEIERSLLHKPFPQCIIKRRIELDQVGGKHGI